MSTESAKKLNIGCGYDYRDGWVNVDNAEHHDKVDVSADAADLSVLPQGYFDYVVARDVLEHIDRPKQVEVLGGWGKLLSEDGILWIRVPSFLDLAWLAMTHPDKATAEAQHELIQCGWGTQAYPGDFHTCCYTPLTLLDYADQVGLRIASAGLKDEWLFEIEFKRKTSNVSDLEWLHEAYMRHVCRPADAGGLAHFLSQLETGTQSREHIAQNLMEAKKSEAPRRGG